jgi:hypothetical protein
MKIENFIENNFFLLVSILAGVATILFIYVVNILFR